MIDLDSRHVFSCRFGAGDSTICGATIEASIVGAAELGWLIGQKGDEFSTVLCPVHAGDAKTELAMIARDAGIFTKGDRN